MVLFLIIIVPHAPFQLEESQPFVNPKSTIVQLLRPAIPKGVIRVKFKAVI
jgi:hypothetical protein